MSKAAPRTFTVTDHPGRACAACRHYRIQRNRAYCIHPAYRLPVKWEDAIAPGQPCGADNAPLWEPR